MEELEHTKTLIADTSNVSFRSPTSITSWVTNPYLATATSDNTRKAYRSDIKHYEKWGGVLPATSEMIVHYLQAFAAKLNARTLARRLIAIKHWHTYQGFPDPNGTNLRKKYFKNQCKTPLHSVKFVSTKKPNKRKEALVNINNIFQNSSHPKSILAQLKSTEGLPFREVLSSEKIATYVENSHIRDRVFSPDITMWGFLSQVLSDDKSCQAAVARVIAFFASQGKLPPSANTAAYSKARLRLPEAMISSLARASAEQLEEQAPTDWLWRDRQIKLVDGSTLFMPDTPENQAAYPQSKNQKPGLGFPIARIVAIISYATGVILDLAINRCSGKGTGEHSLLRQLMHVFKPGDIALGDSYYASFFLISMLIQLGVDVVFPIHSGRNHDFRKGKRIGKKDHIVQWHKPLRPDWMNDEEYNLFPEKISIREVGIENKRKGFRSQSRIIVTTFLDFKSVNKPDLKKIYDYRWCVELDLKSIKDTMRMGILRGKTPLMVRKEIWTHTLAYNLIRKIMAQAALIHNKKPRNLSFKLALQVIEAFRYLGIFSESKNKIYAQLLKAIAYKTVGNRPGRHEPRRLKRRPKNYPLLLKPRYHYHQGVA